jgi:hypothetical protein
MRQYLLTTLLLVGILSFSDCKKKDDTTKDTITQLVLLAGGNSGAGTSCIAKGQCLEVQGLPPIGYDFNANDCVPNGGTIQAATCAAQGYTKCTSKTLSIAATISVCSR